MPEPPKWPNYRIDNINEPSASKFDIFAIANLKTGRNISRRELLKVGGAAVASLGLNGLLASCGGGGNSSSGSPQIDTRSVFGHGFTYAAAHSNSITAVAWSPDGQKIAAGEGNTGTIKIWDTASGNLIISFSSGLGLVSMDWSPDGSRLAAASLYNGKVFDAATGQLQFKIESCGHCIKYSHDGSRIATGGKLQIWDANNGVLVKAADDTKESLYIDWSPDGSKVVCGYDYGAVKIWDSNTGSFLLNLVGHANSVTVRVRVKWSPDGSKIASYASQVIIWDAITGDQTLSKNTDLGLGDSIHWSPDNGKIYIGFTNNSCGSLVAAYDAVSGNKLQSIGDGMTDRPVVSALSSDGSRLLTGIEIKMSTGLLIIWSADTGNYLMQFTDASLPENSTLCSCPTAAPWMKSCTCNTVCVCDTVDYCRTVVCYVD